MPSDTPYKPGQKHEINVNVLSGGYVSINMLMYKQKKI